MLEFIIGMKYCLDRNRLDCVILHDEREEMDDMIFVPERTCRMEHNERKRGVYCSHCGKRMDSFVCNNYGDGTMEYAYPFCCKCGAEVMK